MELLINKLREDFILVAKHRRESGEWTAEEEAEIGAAIKAAIDRKDADMVACWCRWLADLAAWCVAYALIVRGSERRMREQVKAEKAAKEKK